MNVTAQTAEYQTVRAAVRKDLDSVQHDIKIQKELVLSLKARIRDSEGRLVELATQADHLAAFLERTA